ncbi:aminoglycoside phosphotransferase family protein [Psychrobacillus sp. NPDC058041]|uniref:aminoglycoside phosphotransferase family protein n=1 Tax=Psychrobacillus sp. NPDC058041 TaxID=3346310 RepID=UPI0036DB006D
MIFPRAFEMKIIGAFGEVGKEWLGTLETLVDTYLEKWNLQSEGAVENLSYNYVLKVVEENGKKGILKLGIANYDFENEIRTLLTYNGKGCVKIIKEDSKNGAMLLEHLQPGTMLTEVEEHLAVKHFSRVWNAIRRKVEENSNHPSVRNWMQAFDRYQEKFPSNDGPIPQHFVSLAKAYFYEIANSSNNDDLLHGDLHHENILYSNNYGWLAIDPKGVIGDTYFDFISFLTNQLFNKLDPRQLLEKRVNILCDEMQLNKERLLKAAVAMSTLYACWGIEDSDPEWDNSFKCAQWFEEFMSFI